MLIVEPGNRLIVGEKLAAHFTALIQQYNTLEMQAAVAKQRLEEAFMVVTELCDLSEGTLLLGVEKDWLQLNKTNVVPTPDLPPEEPT